MITKALVTMREFPGEGDIDMRTLLNIIFVSTIVLGAVSCSKERELPDEIPFGPVTLTAHIADETKATLNETSGAFAFSSDDAIKVYNGTGLYASTGVNISGGVATFTMADGFENTGSGFAAFPAGIVDNITADGVTFTLPSSYTYSEVGGADASAAKVPCPMIAGFSAGSELSFKQAGAVIRIRITECVAGSITFTFTSKVTGTVTLASVPSTADGGILAANLSDGGYSITVTGVPEVTTGNYIFFTLPVPTGTDPLNVGIWNHGTFQNKVATLRNATPGSLNRAGGWKRSASLTDVEDAATFDGKILAGDLFFIGSYSYEIIEDPLEVLKYFNSNNTTSDDTDTGIKKCFYSWNFLNSKGFAFTIGGKTYRVPSSGNDGDWAGIAGTATSRPKAKVKGTDARYAFLTVTGLASETYHTSSIGGLLLFPDNAIIASPSGAKLDIFDDVDGTVYNNTTNNNTVPLSGLTYLLNQGCTFIPTAGYWNKSDWYYLYWGRGWYGINEAGSYWSDSAYSSDHAYALTVLRNHTTYEKPNLIDPSAHDEKGNIYLPVRLIREPATP